MNREYVIIDTSIFLELLNVPNKANNSEQVWKDFDDKSENGVVFFIPLAVIFETGNHIAQNGDGRQRRSCAEKFVFFVTKMLNAESPFHFIDFCDKEEISSWINEFPNYGSCGVTFGDFSILKDLKKLQEKFPNENISIWTLDKQLDSYSIKGK